MLSEDNVELCHFTLPELQRLPCRDVQQIVYIAKSERFKKNNKNDAQAAQQKKEGSNDGTTLTSMTGASPRAMPTSSHVARSMIDCEGVVLQITLCDFFIFLQIPVGSTMDKGS